MRAHYNKEYDVFIEQPIYWWLLCRQGKYNEVNYFLRGKK